MQKCIHFLTFYYIYTRYFSRNAFSFLLTNKGRSSRWRIKEERNKRKTHAYLHSKNCLKLWNSRNVNSCIITENTKTCNYSTLGLHKHLYKSIIKDWNDPHVSFPDSVLQNHWKKKTTCCCASWEDPIHWC